MKQSTAARESATLKDKIEQEVDEFFDMCFDPVKELKDQLGRLGKNWKKSGIDWKRVEEYDTLYISRLFDLVEWWKNRGIGLFPHVVVAVPSIIAVPSSNGHQERTFSTCTYFDDELRSRLKEERFEMAVLIAVNKTMTKIEIPTSNEAKAIVSKAVANVVALSSDLESKLDKLGIPDGDRDAFREATNDIASPRKLFGEEIVEVSD